MANETLRIITCTYHAAVYLHKILYNYVSMFIFNIQIATLL